MKNLPSNGKIVVIDDNYKEVQGLIKALSQMGVPCLYFDGERDTLPNEPIRGIRFLFLDIELKNATHNSPEMKAHNLFSRIEKIMGNEVGLYFIIFWTKCTDTINTVITLLKARNMQPVDWIDLEKPSSGLNDEDKEWSLSAITDKIKYKLESIGAFKFYIEWENMLCNAGADFVNTFSKLAPFNQNPNKTDIKKIAEKWSNDTHVIFSTLFRAYAGKNTEMDPIDKFRKACAMLNMSFFDTLQRYTQKELSIPEKFNLENATQLEKPIIAKINTALFIETQNKTTSSNAIETQKRTISSGALMYLRNLNLQKDLQNELIKTSNSTKNIRLCCLVITPACDLAQDKIFKRGEKEKNHRVIYGLSFIGDKSDLKKANSPAIFATGPFWLKKKAVMLVFHFGTISQLDEGKMKDPAFSLKQDLVFDIQSKAANHVNRLGNYVIDFDGAKQTDQNKKEKNKK